jgi:hypothetical protein
MKPGPCAPVFVFFIACMGLSEHQHCPKIAPLTGCFDGSCEQEFDNPESTGYTTANSSIAAKEKT